MIAAVFFTDHEGMRHILTANTDISEVKLPGKPDADPNQVQITSLPQMGKMSWKAPGVSFDKCAELVTQSQALGNPFILNITALQQAAKGEATQRAALPLPRGDTSVNGTANTLTHQPGGLSVT